MEGLRHTVVESLGTLLGTLAEELFQQLLELGHVVLGLLERVGDLLQANFLIRLGSTVQILLVTVLLNDLAAILNLVEAEGRRRALQKMAKGRQLAKIRL